MRSREQKVVAPELALGTGEGFLEEMKPEFSLKELEVHLGRSEGEGKAFQDKGVRH
jgi:hypothetical protein